MHSDINDLLINITLDSAQIDGAFLLCKVMFTIITRDPCPSPSPSTISSTSFRFQLHLG